MSIDDEANYTVHLVQTLEDDVYVTRGDSFEGIDGAGTVSPSYRHLAEGAEVQRGARGTLLLQSDENAEGKYNVTILRGPRFQCLTFDCRCYFIQFTTYVLQHVMIGVWKT